LSGLGTPELVGIDWRLDYHVQSSITGHDNEPVYYVTLKVLDKDGKKQDIAMACSLEELQNMHSKVKDAAKQVGCLDPDSRAHSVS
jgi:hypothetical protein